MESGVTLADLRKEENLETNCNKLGIEYITPEPNETKNERDARHQQLQLSINNKRRCQNNAESPDKRRRVRDSNTAAQRHRRANLSPEQQESERRNITAFRQRQRANLSPEQQENARRINTGSRQQQRANRQEVHTKHLRLNTRSLSCCVQSSKSGTKSSIFIGKECQYDVVFSESGTSGFARYARSALKDSTLSSVITCPETEASLPPI